MQVLDDEDDEDQPTISPPKPQPAKPQASTPKPNKIAAATAATSSSTNDDDDNEIPDSMAGLRFAITGTLSTNRNDVVKLINQHGGTFLPDVTKNVTHLLAEGTFQDLLVKH